MDSFIYSQPIEKRTINWKDPQVRQLLDDFINGKLPLRNIPEFANHINKICNTNITLSTIRNRVYQEQRERKLLLKGMQVAANLPSTSSPSLSTPSLPSTPKNQESIASTAPPDPEPVSVLQAVPVMLRGDDGNEIQGFAILSGDSNQVIVLPEGMQINTETMNNMQPLQNPSIVSPIPKALRKKVSPAPVFETKPEPFTIELTDEPQDDWRDDLEAFYTQPEPKTYKGPEAPATHKLPSEFLNHFNGETFRVDMDSLKQLSEFVREKVEYLEQATEVFPNHMSFHNTNADAFKRNLDVIKQAGDYFEPLLSFENDSKFFPNAVSEIGRAIIICAQNGTAMVDQFQLPTLGDKTILPGTLLTKNGMTNLCILLHGILLEAESLIREYEKLKTRRKVNKVKMMMLTLQFARYYKLAGEMAKSAIITSKNSKTLTEQLNKLTVIKLAGNILQDEEDEDDDGAGSIIPKQEPPPNIIELGDSPEPSLENQQQFSLFNFC